jgi:restriction system protein
VWPKARLRTINAEARRIDRANRAAAHQATQEANAQAAERSHSVQEHVVSQNKALQTYLDKLNGLLAYALGSDKAFEFSRLKSTAKLPQFEPGPLVHASLPPDLAKFLPAAVHGLGAHLPGAKKQYEIALSEAQAKFQAAQDDYQRRETARLAALAEAKLAFEQNLAQLQQTTNDQHAEVDDLERRFIKAEPEAIVEYFEAVLTALRWPFDRARDDRVAYSAASAQLVIELEMPGFEVVPEFREFKFVKSRGETKVPMPATQRKAIYSSLLSQVALRTLHQVFEADHHSIIQSVVLNGHVETVDPRTGQRIHPCLITLRTTRDIFVNLNLGSVDPAACLKGLNASISRSPAELAPVKPVLEFNMVDPRFVQKSDVLSELDSRPNLMELSPSEFESLITNLFEKMGLETRLTQASRDGGVDCVAYDARPVLGGKVVIQAKRYKNTVGVSAVRDLFGTMQNEGATKGILVTTSGYGAASFDFAAGKPLELLDGANLLFLLQEHAGIEAKIEPPDDWVDPEADR